MTAGLCLSRLEFQRTMFSPVSLRVSVPNRLDLSVAEGLFSLISLRISVGDQEIALPVAPCNYFLNHYKISRNFSYTAVYYRRSIREYPWDAPENMA